MEEIRRDDEFGEDIEYIGRIKMQYASLSKSQKRIANYILNHREAVIHHSITTMAQKTGTVPSTVTRFCQALSYKGFSEMKVYMEKNLASPLTMDALIQKTDTLQVVLQKLMNSSQNAIQDTMRTLDARSLTEAVDAILAAGNILLFGQSGGYISATYARQLLLRINVLSQAVNDRVDAKPGGQHAEERRRGHWLCLQRGSQIRDRSIDYGQAQQGHNHCYHRQHKLHHGKAGGPEAVLQL